MKGAAVLRGDLAARQRLRRWVQGSLYLAVIALAVSVTGCPENTKPPVRRDQSHSPLPPPLMQQRPTPPPPSIAPRPPAKTLRGTRIVIDPGHGGKDPGARGVSALYEKSIVLSIGNEVHRQLTARGASVVNTRSSDRYLELDDRAAIAQRNRCALFVSIHADSAKRTTAYGATIYIGRNAGTASFAAARRIQAALTSAGIACRGIERAGFRVLIGHSRPAVLVECGYLTNTGDARRLNSASYRTFLAGAIATGVANYILGG